MSLYRRAAKRDEAEPAIVDAFLAAGFSVKRVSVKDGGDLVLGKNGIDRWAEVKTGNKPLKPGQADWARDWRGAPPLVLRSLEDAERVIRTWPSR